MAAARSLPALLLAVLALAAVAAEPAWTVPATANVAEDTPAAAVPPVVVSGISLPTTSTPRLVAVSQATSLIAIDGFTLETNGTSALLRYHPLADGVGTVPVFLALYEAATPGVWRDQPSLTATVAITITPVADPPRIVMESSIAVGSGGSVQISRNQFDVSDPDYGIGSVTLTLTQAPAHGALFLGDTMLADGSAFDALYGRTGDGSWAFQAGNGLRYRHDGDGSATDTFTVLARANTSGLSTGPVTIPIAISGVASPYLRLPAISDYGATFPVWSEAVRAPTPVLVQPELSLPAGVDLADAIITVRGDLQHWSPEDRLDIAASVAGVPAFARSGDQATWGGRPFAAITAGGGRTPLVLVLHSAAATRTAVEALLAAVTFDTGGGTNPYALPRTLSVQIAATTGDAALRSIQLAIATIDDPPILPDGLRLSTVPEAARRIQVLPIDADGTTIRCTWAVTTQPTNGTLTIEQGTFASDLTCILTPSSLGSGTAALTVTYGNDGAHLLQRTYTVPVLVSDLDGGRPHPCAEPPRHVAAGSTVDLWVPWDTGDLAEGAHLVFSLVGAAPNDLLLTPDGGRVRITWRVPAATPAGTRYRFRIMADDPTRGLPGFLPIDVLVRAMPAGTS